MSRMHLAIASLSLVTMASLSVVQAQQPAPQQNTQPGRQAADQSQARVAGQQQSGVPLTAAIANKLMKANQAEIELAQMALQKAENPQIQQLAQKLVQDHQAMNQQLMQFASGQAGGAAAQRSGEGQTSRFQRTSATLGESQSETPQSSTSQQNQTQQSQQTQATQRTGQQAHAGASQWSSARVPQQLSQLMDQACDNALEMTKEMLSQHSGQDFQMAFLGQQTVAHIQHLAELKAIESMGPAELQPIARQATSQVQQHLDQTKQLAKQFEDDRQAGSNR